MHVTIKKFNALVERINHLTDEALLKLSAFLLDLHENEYKKLLEIWTLPHINDSMWHNYKLLAIQGLPEQVSLENALSAFKLKVKSFRFKGPRHEKREKVAAKRNERVSGTDQ